MDDGPSLVKALLYGKLDGLSEEMVFLFARTGLTHLFSASGFHLAAAVLVAQVLERILALALPRGRVQAGTGFALQLSLMVFFGAATDWSSPMVRAFVFTGLHALSRLLELRSDRAWVFLLSLVASAALGKGGTLSFLLSALGMAGLLFVQPRRAFAILLGPWLFTLPLTIWCFGLFPLLAPLWNLTFGPAISFLVLPPAIVSLLLSSVGIPAGALDFFAEQVMLFLVQALDAAAGAAGLAFWVAPLPWVLLAAGWLFFGGRFSRRWCVVLGGLTLGAARAFPLPALALLDVGQGDATLLRTRSGALVLHDVGPPGLSVSSAPVCRALEGLGIGALEHVALSHFDLDHRGGLDSLLTRHLVKGALWVREEALQAKGASEVLAAAERAGVGLRFLRENSAPPGHRCWLAPFSGNDSSPLCRAEFEGGGAILLTGDMGARTEEWLLARVQPFPRAAFLKLPHHGSAGSSTQSLLRESGASIALIGVGRRNRYGHPSSAALERLSALGIRARRTDLEGTVAVYFPGFTDEIIRVGVSREKPGSPALARRVYAAPASVK